MEDNQSVGVTPDSRTAFSGDVSKVAIDQSENQSVMINQPAESDQTSSGVEAGLSEPCDVEEKLDAGDPCGAGEEVAARKPRAKETRERRTKGMGGLQLERSGMWTLRCVVNGKRISKSTGTRNRAEAEQFAKRFLAPYVKDDAARTYANIQAAVMTERQLAEMRAEEGPQLKMADAWAAYVASPMRRDLAPTTLHTKAQVFRVFVSWLEKMYPEVVEVRHLTRGQVENYLNSLRADHSSATYNNRLCVLREVFRTIMRQARARENPWEGFPMRADDSHTRRELTIQELTRLVDNAAQMGFEWRTLFGIAMYTGLRLGDCCKLTWSEVDIVRSIIQKVPEKTKKYRKGRPVTVPIHKVLADLLMQTPLEERTGYVLPQIGALAAEGVNGMGKIHSRISKIFRRAGIVTSVTVEGRRWKAPDAGFHSLRHTFVSMSANAGVPLHIVQSIVGHESSAMTRHYYHENVEALQRAVEAIPSISETGVVTAGEVAQPDTRRLMPSVPPRPPPLPLQAPAATPDTVVGVDGVERVSPSADAPLVGRMAERNAVRRENKLAIVEQANASAATMGGWGLAGDERVSTLPNVNRRQRTAWIGTCVRRWCACHHIALLEGTMQLVSNGGYRLLQALWDKGVPVLPEDALEALDVFLKAKRV